MTREIETRILGVNLEARSDSPAVRLVGYAAVFGEAADIGGEFREVIVPGAFAEALARSDVFALYNHNENIVLGRAKSGTLRMVEDSHGLKVEIDPPDTQDARDLLVKMKRGDIDQMSFAFTLQGGVQRWDRSSEPPLRTIEKIGRLFDVSVVPRGAYPTTEVAARSLAEHLKHTNFSAVRLRKSRQLDLERKLRRPAG